jgi:hypothetical protein
VSTHGLNTQRMSAVQKVWSSYVYATILLQHGPSARRLRGRESSAAKSPFLEDKSLMLKFKAWARDDLEHLTVSKVTEWINV